MLCKVDLSAAAACILVAGCATEAAQPTEQITRAHTLVEAAQKSGAQRYAAADLQRAQDELSDAEKANTERKYDEARRYAEAAAADADVASARAAAGEAQRAAREVQKSNEAVSEEAAHGTTDSPTPN